MLTSKQAEEKLKNDVEDYVDQMFTASFQQINKLKAKFDNKVVVEEFGIASGICQEDDDGVLCDEHVCITLELSYKIVGGKDVYKCDHSIFGRDLLSILPLLASTEELVNKIVLQ